MIEFIVINCTVASTEEAEIITKALIDEKLVACVGMHERVFSTFCWQGEVYRKEEISLSMKTRSELFYRVEAKIKELHSYNVPEIIATPILIGSEDYLAWIEKETV